MPNPKIEWLRTVLGVEVERSDEGSPMPDSRTVQDALRNLLRFAPDSVPLLDETRVLADDDKAPGQPAPDAEAVNKLTKKMAALNADLAKIGDIENVTPELNVADLGE